MYFDALSFLEDEREAWRPFEALLDVPPDRFESSVADAHGWSARELLSHLLAWQSHALEVARELAMGEHSRAHAAMEAAWSADGDAVNAWLSAAWGALTADEVLRRARVVPGELRGYLTVVPEARWVKHPVFGPFFEGDLLDHYAEHEADLRAILAAVTATDGLPPAAGEAADEDEADEDADEAEDAEDANSEADEDDPEADAPWTGARSLAELMVGHAVRLQGTEEAPVDEGVEIRLDGTAFAVVAGDVAELHLRPEVAAAALRTPDVTPSRRGEGWIHFGPAAFNRYARDRAIAWLESAWRLADQGGS